MEYQSILYKTKTLGVRRNQPSVPCFKPLKMCMFAMVASSFLDCTCRMLIRRNVVVTFKRNLFQLWSQRSVVDIKDINILYNLVYKQTHCEREATNTEGRQTNTLHDQIDTKVR